MIGGGHVRRQSISSVIEGSPCVRMGRKKKDLNSVYDSPGQARIVEKPSIASTSSYQFGGERMIKAQRGLLARQSLEETCLIADGEDLSASCKPIFYLRRTSTYISQSSYLFSLVPVQHPDLALALALQALAATLLPSLLRMVLQSQAARSQASI